VVTVAMVVLRQNMGLSFNDRPLLSLFMLPIILRAAAETECNT
jgi:hypothetical protein